MIKKIETLEKQLDQLTVSLQVADEKINLLTKSFFELGLMLKEKTIIQQQLLEHVGILSEALCEMQASQSSSVILKYDMPNEPYN